MQCRPRVITGPWFCSQWPQFICLLHPSSLLQYPQPALYHALPLAGVKAVSLAMSCPWFYSQPLPSSLLSSDCYLTEEVLTLPCFLAALIFPAHVAGEVARGTLCKGISIVSLVSGEEAALGLAVTLQKGRPMSCATSASREGCTIVTACSPSLALGSKQGNVSAQVFGAWLGVPTSRCAIIAALLDRGERLGYDPSARVDCGLQAGLTVTLQEMLERPTTMWAALGQEMLKKPVQGLLCCQWGREPGEHEWAVCEESSVSLAVHGLPAQVLSAHPPAPGLSGNVA